MTTTLSYGWTPADIGFVPTLQKGLRTLIVGAGEAGRALARDLGQELGVGGHLTVLRRTAVGRFGLGQAHTLDELGDHPPDALPLVDLSAAARQTFPVRELTEEQAADVRVGRRLEADLGAAGPVAVFAPTGGFLALYEQRGPLALPVAVFTG